MTGRAVHLEVDLAAIQANARSVRAALSGVPAARFGDEVLLLGRQGDAQITLAELAAWSGRDELHFLGTLPRHLARRPGPSTT